MNKQLLYLLLAALLIGINTNAQELEPQSAEHTGTITLKKIEPSLASKKKIKSARSSTKAIQDGRSSKNLVIPGKDKQSTDDYLSKNPHPLKGKYKGKTPELVYNINSNVISPSDPAIAVGIDHVFIVYNEGFIIYDKEGNDLTGPLDVDNIFSPGGCCDLTASYDNAADRWILTILFYSGGVEVALSDGPDPINSNWLIYSTPLINDYQKLSVWSDGYYISDHTAGNIKIWALDRDGMLASNTSAGIQGFALPGLITDGFHSPQVLNISDDNTPAHGGVTIVYEQDDAWAGVNTDHIKFWNLDVDWSNPDNSLISIATEFEITPFIGVFDGGVFFNLTQPDGGSDIDALQAMIMNQAQFRKFPNHNSAVFNFVVDTDGGPGELAGIRWYEFRQDSDGQPWSLYQEGTYTAPNEKHAWMASMIMDYEGNIGMGYSSMAGPNTPNPSTHKVGSFYTGRYAADPLGVMTIGEEIISAGTENIVGTRFGDYSKIDIDPTNDKDFWFITEKKQIDVVGVFQIAGDLNNDIGVVSIDAPVSGALSNSEQVKITIFNYGIEAASGFDISYQIDGASPVTETFIGNIAPATSAEFIFITTADLSIIGHTYSIISTTIYPADQFTDNDATTSSVTHIYSKDLGVSAINNPNSGSGMSENENITISISNYGTDTETNIPVHYSINAGTTVQETYIGSITQGASDEYTFTSQADLSALGTYDIIAGTELSGDMDESNDDYSKTIENYICQPISNCSGFADGVTELQFADQNISTDCSSSGYTDNTDIIFNIILNDNPFEGILQMGFSGSNYSLWIDFNDDYTFDASEVISEGIVPEANTDFGFTIDFSSIADPQGEHRMRLRGGDETSSTGDVNNPCDDITYGRTNDYTANISGTVGVDEYEFANSSLYINNIGGNQFQLTFTSQDYSKDLSVFVQNNIGQSLAYYTIKQNNSTYNKTIDMSNVPTGVYFIKIADAELNMIKRIIVE